MGITKCIIQCREADFCGIKTQLPEFELIEHDKPLPASARGGVICYTEAMKIYVDNTVEKRVEMAF